MMEKSDFYQRLMLDEEVKGCVALLFSGSRPKKTNMKCSLTL